MSAINPNDLAKFKGILEVRPAGTSGAYTRLASVRGLVGNIDTSEVIDVKADDTGSVFKVANTQATVEAELLENMGRDVLALLFTGTNVDVAGSATPVVAEAMGTTLGAGTIYTFLNKNGAGTQVASISLADTGGALVLNTDYTLGVNADGYTYAVILVATTGATTCSYTYTPNASEKITISVDSTAVKSFDVKITAVDSGKNRIINLTSAAFTSTYGMNFADVVEQGDITGATLTFTADKGSNFIYTNEIL